MTPSSEDPSQLTEAEIIRGVVRGEIPLSSLTLASIDWAVTSDFASVEYGGMSVVVPETTDLARGFATYRWQPDELQSWATVLLAGSAFLDLGAVEGRPNGDRLIEALWEAADRGSLAIEYWEIIGLLNDL